MRTFLVRRLVILFLATVLSGHALWSRADGLNSPDQINGPPPPPEPPKTLPSVNASAFSWTAHWGTSFVLAPSGNANAYIGHAFVTSSLTPSAIPENNQDPCNKVADPILPATGTKVETYSLFSLPGEMGLRYVLYLKNGGWYDNLGAYLDTNCFLDPPDIGACKYTTLYRADGSSIVFYGGPNATSYLEQNSSINGLVILTRDPSSGNYTLHDEDATTQIYSPSGTLLSIVDASGIGWTFTTSGNQTVVTHTSGQSFTLTKGAATQTTVNGHTVWLQTNSVVDPAGNVYTINYSNSAVTSIVYPGTPSTVVSFAYITSNGSRLSEVDYNGVPYAYTTYVTDSTNPNYGWANGTHLADGSMNVSIVYQSWNNGTMTVTITNPLGHQSTESYDSIVYSGRPGGVANARLTLISDAAVVTCGGTTHGRSYDTNNHLSATIDNNGNTHSYSYAANGQLQTETEAYGTADARTTDYVWDPNEQLNRPLSITVEGWKKTTYTYNAQNRLASVSVTNLSPNGSANQTLTTTYTYSLYGNGMVHTMSVTRPSPNGSDTDTSTYDALGNLISFNNGLGQTTSYSNYNALGEVGHVVGPNGDATDYSYDARGRIATKTTYPNGSAATWTYSYDGFGLLYTLTGPDGQVTTWNRDTTMRVQTIVHNDKDGASTESFSYDANGDVIEHKISRGSVVALDEVFHYDALGRVYQKIGQNGQSLTYAYDGNGNVLSVSDAVGHTVSHQYDALNRVTQTVESGGGSPAMPTGSPSLNVPGSSTSGAYTVSWNSITGATYYVLQEKVGGGAWGTVQSGSAITWAASSKPTNTYSYQAKACNATGCGSWSAVGTISVTIPTAPTSAPNLSVPGSSATGNYTVSWTSVTNTSTYNLQEQINGGAWSTIQNNASLSWGANGKTNGTYAYRSQACNATGCGPWSNTGTVVVAWPPIPAAPSISVPARNYSGSYTVSWNAVTNATTYPLYQSVNGGSWSLVQNNASTSWSVSGEGNGQYSYFVGSCDMSGCASSTSSTATVIIPSPLSFNGGNYWATNMVTVSGNEGIGFDIVNGNTWELFQTKPGNAHVVNFSGAVPWGATTVQFTWTDAGVPSGFTNALGSIVYNYASSPVAISNNPATIYTTNTFNKNGDHAHSYSFRVDFFDAAGVNISSTTCTLTAEVVGNL